MLHRHSIRLAIACLALAGTAHAAEYAVLETGFRLRAARHETVGDRIRLISEDGGIIELPASVVVRFEKDDYQPAVEAAETSEPDQAPDLDALIDEIAEQQQLPPALVHSVVAAESAYDPNAVSPKGAVGLMQLMPQTAGELEVDDPKDPAQNLQGGTSYLKQLLERYSGSSDQLLRALAAYNAGPQAVERHDGLPPYNETRRFVRQVIQRFLRLTEPANAE